MKKLSLLLALLTSTAFAGQPHSILFIIDDSGSMWGEPLRKVKMAIDKGMNKMPQGNYGGMIVTNGCGEANTKIDVPIQINPHQKIRARAGKLQGSGAEDIVLSLKYAEREAAKRPEMCTHIIMLTDGVDTCNSVNFTMDDYAKKITDMNNCNEVNVISMGLVEQWEHDILDTVAKVGRGNHKAKQDASEVLEEVVTLVNSVYEDNGVGGGWRGDYKGPNGDGDDGRNPPPRPPAKEKKKEKEKRAGASAGGSNGKRGRR